MRRSGSQFLSVYFAEFAHENLCRRAQIIKRECDVQLEDAKRSQVIQADLMDKLQARILSFSARLVKWTSHVLHLFSPRSHQAKVVEFRDKYESSNKRLIEVTQVANQAQIRAKDTNEVLISLEERLRSTEVCCISFFPVSFFLSLFIGAV